MDKTSVAERAARLIAAFMAGAEAEMREIRGRGLTPAEREEFEELARRDAEVSLELAKPVAA